MRKTASGPSNARLRAVLAALFCVVAWAVNYPAMKVAFREVDPLAYAGARFSLAAAVLLAAAIAARRPLVPPPGERAHAALLALTGIGVYQAVFTFGVAATSAFSAALLNGVSPILSMALAAALGREALTGTRAAGSAVAYAGVALFAWVSRGPGGTSLGGSLLCLASAASWAVYTVASLRRREAAPTRDVQLWTFLGGTAVLLAYAAPAMLRQDWGRVGALSATILIASALLPLVLAFRAWTFAIQTLGVGSTTTLGFLIPVVAGISSAAWTGERFGVAKLGAAAVVLAGLALTRVPSPERSLREPRAPAPPAA